MIPYVEWAITAAAIEHLRGYYLVHAGIVARGDRGVMLPAASGSGKSSVVAKLVGAGWQYLSDEVGVIEPASGLLLPFAKSLHLHQGAREALAAMHPALTSGEPYQALDAAETWYLPAQPDWLPSEPVRPSLAVVPSYEPGTRTELVAAPASAILATLLEQSFNLREHGARGIGDLVRLLGGVRAYTLTFGNLDEAAAILEDLVTSR